MKIAMGSDHGGYRLKSELTELIRGLGHELEDVGPFNADSVDYPDYALEVCNRVVAGQADRGILVCGTGIGMSIAANKIPGIRCALVHDVFSAKATREHNDSNVIAMGERVIGPGLAQEIVSAWLSTDYSKAERHQNRIDKIRTIEEQSSIHP